MHFELNGTRNFRSLQGLPTVDGRRIAGHILLRSDQLDLLVEKDWALLQSLGLKAVCDLRSAGERARHPNNLPLPGLRQIAMEVISDVRGDPTLAAALTEQPNAQGAVQLMLEIYRRLPGSLAPHLRTLLGLLQEDAAALLVHCAAGKDRTGFAVAVLLHALGATPEAILADYLLSARPQCVNNPLRRSMVGDIVSRMTGLDAGCALVESMVDVIMDVRPTYLQTALDAVNTDYGSMDGYILRHAGLDARALQALRLRAAGGTWQCLLAPSPPRRSG